MKLVVQKYNCIYIDTKQWRFSQKILPLFFFARDFGEKKKYFIFFIFFLLSFLVFLGLSKMSIVLRISEDVRVLDQYTTWASQYWPLKYIDHCMTTYDSLKPQEDNEDSTMYQRRRSRALKNLQNRYGKCSFTCHHQDCEQKRQRSYHFYQKMSMS